MYPKHEYGYPSVGRFQKKQETCSVFDEEDAFKYNSTLSYYARPGVTMDTTQFHQSHEDRLLARKNILEKKAKLQEILIGIKPKGKETDISGNTDIENVTDPENSPKKKKKTKKKKEEKPESEPDSSEVELAAESEDCPEGDEVPERVKKFFWTNKYKSRKYDDQFDTYYHLDE